MMGLSKTLCDDLSILLLGPRQGNSISWAMDNIELQTACLEFMKNFETQYEEKELNYLKVDYSKFDNLPRPEIDDYGGIEKGYEMYLVEEENEEEPLPPKKKKKKANDSELSNSEDFDYLYSSAENSEGTSNEQRKKKKYQRRSSSDSDFKPSSKKSKEKKLIKRRPKKTKQNEENNEVKKVTVKSEPIKSKKIKDVSNNFVKTSYKMKPCMRPTLILKNPVKTFTKLNPVPEKKISLLRLIRKVKICNDPNDSLPSQRSKLYDKHINTVVTLDPSHSNQIDRIKEMTALNHQEREKYLDLSSQKSSFVIKTKPRINPTSASVHELLSCRNIELCTDDSIIPRPIFKKGQPPELSIPL